MTREQWEKAKKRGHKFDKCPGCGEDSAVSVVMRTEKKGVIVGDFCFICDWKTERPATEEEIKEHEEIEARNR